MRENYTLIRLYVDVALSTGADIILPKAQQHYLASVLRKDVGDGVRVFNGRDGEWQAEITELSRKTARLICQQNLRPQTPSPDIELVFAPVRKHRTAFIVEKATELGVSVLQPLITEHTQFSRFNQEKALLQAIEAAEQTERLDVPDIGEPLNGVEALIEHMQASDRIVIFADEAGETSPARGVIAELDAPAALLVGPEGGFSAREREMLHAQDFVRAVSLGPRILRADTAALSLLTLWQSLKGDW